MYFMGPYTLKIRGDYLLSNPENKAMNFTDSQEMLHLPDSQEMRHLPDTNYKQHRLSAYFHAPNFKSFNSLIKW